MSRHLTDKQQKWLSIAAIALFILFTAAVCWFIGRPMLRFVSQPEVFRDWVEKSGFWGQLLFIGMMAFQTIIAIIPGEPLEIGAGYAFGSILGTVLCIIGTTLGSIVVFWLVRRFGERAAHIFVSVEKLRQMKFLQNSKRLNVLTFIVFLIPGTPKDVLTYFVGLTPMKLGTWIAITAVARIPSVITSTMGGNALGLQNYTTAIVVFGAALVISGVGLLIYRRISTHHDKDAGHDTHRS